MSVKFCPIASGSSGNCIFVASDKANILIDAGISGIRVIEGLKRINISPDNIDAIFVTHDHSDHIKGAGIFSRKFKIPIHATKGSWQIMKQSIGKVEEQHVKVINPDKAFKFKDMEITPFTIPHDAGEPVGFSIHTCGAKITVATDMGHPTDSVKEMLADSDIILLEANHDVELLKKGPYPFYLKKRILGDRGHLSNIMAAELLSESVSDRLKHVYLGHLSEENNTAELAFETVYGILKQNGKMSGKFTMRCAQRSEVSALAEIGAE